MKTKYLEEVRMQLLRAECTAEFMDGRTLQIALDGKPLCQVCDTGGLRYFEEDVAGRDAALDRVRDIAVTTREYMRFLDMAPHLTVDGLGEGYRLLAEFNSVVLGGKMTKYGAQFITWEWVHDQTSLWRGNYYGPGGGAKDYAAKRDFTVRSGLLQKNALFEPEPLAEVYRSIHETLDSAYPLTDERRKLLEDAARQIEEGVPDLGKRVELSCRKELKISAPNEGGMHFS